MGLQISLAAEAVSHIGPLAVNNSLLVSWMIVVLLCALAIKISKSLSLVPSRGQVLMEFAVGGLWDLAYTTAGSKAKVFFPYIATIFIFVLISNWSGLIPGVGTILIRENVKGENIMIPLFRAPTSDINTTLALALISVGLIQFYGFKYLGFGYMKKFFNFKNPILTFSGLLELVGEVSKIISFTFRLFGNIFAGEVLLAVMAFLIPVIAPVPFYGLELFVGFIQALVFAMLTLVFLNISTAHEEH